MIAIVDYGYGNILAIGNIYKRLHIPYSFARTPEDLAAADRIILPGVGAFDQAVAGLNQSGMREALDECVVGDKKDVLGICVGLQLMAKGSEEGDAEGLGWVDAEVKRFDATGLSETIHLPHMGWNTVELMAGTYLFDGIDLDGGFYFLHSYYVECHDPTDVLAVTTYGRRFTSVVSRGNMHGIQCHPEKSHQAGVKFLKNFALGRQVAAPAQDPGEVSRC